jgi:hypothetical protein
VNTIPAIKARRASPNWAAHFQAVSSSRTSPAPTADFGTFLKSHTISDLVELLKAKDDEFTALDKDSGAFLPTWRSSSAAAASAWTGDYQKLKSDYAAAKTIAQDAIDAAHGKGALFQLTPDSINTTGDSPYKLVLQSLNPAWAAHSQDSDRIFQLRHRLSAAGATMTQYFVRQPIKDLESPHLVGDVLKAPLAEAAKTAKYTVWAILAGVFVLGVVLIKALAPEAGSIAKAYLPPRST